ncbi:MAG: hypothetical protein ABEN55_12055 [Bradymonadaceae bacterium]
MGDWRQRFGGKRWRIGSDGFIEIEGEGRPRTKGEPVTMRTMVFDYSHTFEAVAHKLRDVAGDDSPWMVPYLATLCALESTRIGDSFHRDPDPIRREPDYVSDDATPDEISPGLMQTLISTAENVRAKHGLWSGEVTREDLMIPYRSVLVAGFYLLDLARREQTWDPVLLSAAYNAGGIYESDDNPFHLRVYHENRPMMTVKWWNDYNAVAGTTCG